MPQDKLEEYVMPPYRKARTFYHSQKHFKHARHAFYRLVEQESPTSILDVGCGTGLDAQPITNLGVEYMGIDPIEENLIYARRDNPNNQFKVGYVQEIPFLSDSYDWIYMCGVWENLPDKDQMKKAIDECLRVARKKVMVLDATAKPRFMMERYMMIPMHYGLSITRVNYNPERKKADYLWCIDKEGIKWDS